MTSLKNTIFNRNLLFPLLILVISLCIVFYQFLIIPKNTTFDEIEFAKLALQLKNKPYTPYSPYATGHATLYFYIILASFKLFGTNLFSLRLPSALFGIINPLIFYFVIKKVFNPLCHPEFISGSLNKNKMLKPVQYDNFFLKHLPFILSFIFITLRWYFNFARFGFEVTFLLFLELCSLYFILKYADIILNSFQDLKKMPKRVRHDKVWLILSGLFAGLAYNSYQPGRVFVLIPIFILLSTLIKNKVKDLPVIPCNGIPSIITLLSYFLIPFFILILPLTIYLNTHKDTRFYQQFYPDNHEMSFQEKKEFFERNLISTSGIFLIKGDTNGRHNYPNKPALNPIIGTFFILGLLIALFHIKNKYHLLFLFWFFLSLAPTLVTYPWENPNMLRTFTVIPSLVYFVGLTLTTIINSKVIQQYKYKKILYAGIIFLVLISSIYELRTYFVHQSYVFREAFEAQHDLKYYLSDYNLL